MQYLARFLNRKWATMLELIAMMAIMGLWISAMLSVVSSGASFAKNTEDTIKAINLAREWIEWVTLWRNTNWLRFSSDRANCWKTLDYNSNCIGWGGWVNDITSGSYVLYLQNGLWYLSGVTAIDFSTNWSWYSSVFQTGLDERWFFTQTWVVMTPTCSSTAQTNCLTPFKREIIIDVPLWNTGSITVSSIVRWKWKRDQSVQLDTTLTNWKSKF